MKRRGFVRAMVAAAAGLLAFVPRVVLSTSDGTLKAAWSKDDEKRWSLERDRFIESCMWNTDEPGFAYDSAHRS